MKVSSTREVPVAFVARLAHLVEHADTHATRGMQDCDLCPPSDDDEHPYGHAEIRTVGADGTRFAAPSLPGARPQLAR